MKKTSGIPLIVLCLFFILVLMNCSIFDIFKEYKEQETVIQGKKYYIDPATLLESVRQGNAEAFAYVTATPTTMPGLPTATPRIVPTQSNPPVRWNQADYLLIAQALFQQVWNEPTDEWKLGAMTYRLRCDEISSGPQIASFQFFKSIQINEDKSSRLERYLWFYPNDNEAEIYESRFDPEYSRLASIDLSKTSIHVEDAIKIAENNGGIEARQKTKNQCEILVYLNRESYSDNWEIKYRSYHDGRVEVLLFSKIDPQTGEFEEIQ